MPETVPVVGSASVTITTAERPWQARSALCPIPMPATPDLRLAEETGTVWRGFGGCFNELGWTALSTLEPHAREDVLDRLFAVDGELGFTFCRLPIGANDYSLDWYSHDEHPGDFAMAHFSIARDEQHLLPYMRAALHRQPALTLFASPWSPPTWLKDPPVYNYGSLIGEARYYDAYARYFVRFVQAYATAGVTIHQVHVQNEPVSSQKFPSCIFTGAEFARFIGGHLAPAMTAATLPTEIWLGTLNGPETDERKWTTSYHHYAGLVLEDAAARAAICGISYQWAGKHALQMTRLGHPELPLIQSENECGDGTNSWRHAWYVADLVHHYLTNDVVAYVYWNMVLAPGGRSTWGWTQNAMITADPITRQPVLNPEYHVMRHYAAIRPGDRRVRCERPWATSAVAYRGTTGVVVVVRNPYPLDRSISIAMGDAAWTVDLPAESLATIRLPD